MGDGWDASDEIGGNILFLYGEKDEIIPVGKMKKAARRLYGDVWVVSFAESWHLIFADLGREKPAAEVASWIAEQVRRPQIRTGDPKPAVSNCAGNGGHGGSAK
jgi:alpha-beta hydrolase superfamily lysophospholipase